MTRKQALAAGILTLITTVASAHEGHLDAGGYFSGFMHPALGWDHVTAMLAVGLWGASMGRLAMWLLPVAFPLAMALGGWLGMEAIYIPAVEAGIAASALVLGLMIAMMVKPPLWLAGVLVAVFAVFHGHAHGTELPEAAQPLAYALGFLCATVLLHIGGLVFGLMLRLRYGQILVQMGGALIALAGAVFLQGAV